MAEMFLGKQLPTFSTEGLPKAGEIYISFTPTEISERELKALFGLGALFLILHLVPGDHKHGKDSYFPHQPGCI